MSYSAPPSQYFLKNNLGTDSSVLRNEFLKLALETANLQNQITSGLAGFTEVLYLGDPELDQSWKLEIRQHLEFKELQFFRKEGDGELAENWVQYASFPQEYGEMYRYNGSTPRTLTNQNQWYPSIGMSAGNCYVITFSDIEGDTYLEIPENHGGLYHVSWQTSFSAPVNHFYEMSISINDTPVTTSISRRKSDTNDVAPLSGSLIASIPDLGKVRIITRCTDAGATAVTFVHSNINIQRI
jgi:hypothetical protein